MAGCSFDLCQRRERGTKVSQGDKLLTLEAMKMQTTICAPTLTANGVLGQIHACVGMNLIPSPPSPDTQAMAARTGLGAPQGLVGLKWWTNAYTGNFAADYGGKVQETNRPLNKYVGAVESFHCPGDKGDALNPVPKSCWQGWGNSYLVQWSGNSFRVRKVTADSKAARGTEQSTPIKDSEVAKKPATKIIQGDWPWHANRSVVDKHIIWHNDKGKRFENMLFGDGHVENFRFPKEMDNWGGDTPDVNFRWW